MSDIKDQILKAIYRKSDGGKKSAFTPDIQIAFEQLAKDAFYDLVIQYVNDGILLDRGRGYVALTPNGMDIAIELINPSPSINHNSIHIGSVVNSPIQQGIHSKLHQKTTYEAHNNSDLQMLVDLIRENLAALKLPTNDEKKVKAQIATIEAQLLDEPNPSIINEAGKTLKNITEGAIGSLLAAAAQPGLWDAVKALLSKF